MGEVHNPTRQEDKFRHDTWKSRPEAGRWGIKTACVAGALALTAASLAAYGYDKGVTRNAAAQFPDGVLPKVSLSDSLLPSAELTTTGFANIDFSKLKAAIEVKEFRATRDVQVGETFMDVHADAPTKYDISTQVTVGAGFLKAKLPAYGTEFDVLRDYDGEFYTQYFVPPDAVSGKTLGDVTHIDIDMSKLESYTSNPTMPTLRQYTIDSNGQKDYSNPESGAEARANIAGSTGSLIDSFQDGLQAFVDKNVPLVDIDVKRFKGFASLSKKLHDLDEESSRYYINSMRSIVEESCNDVFDDQIVWAVEQAYTKEAVNQYGIDPDKLDINLIGNVELSEHYDYDDSQLAVPEAGGGIEDGDSGMFTATANITNSPEDALKAQVSCDDVDFIKSEDQ